MTIKTFLLATCVSPLLGSAVFAAPPDLEWFDHNGSQMTVEYKYDAIRYAFPKSSLKGIIDRNQVVFTGSIVYRGKAEGTAYVYKKGCDWAEYPISGRYDPSVPGFVLTGKAPVRENGGCKVIGYTTKSPNARLVFVDSEERSKRERNVGADAIYENESQPGWAEGFLDGDGKVGKLPK
ncbi:hypothetical protein [uncultured Agrobacterium sp.]|uniref:hypothetical protein n=1 Tax=uncultured Agrobacterium sp. TaxID=157277 RepID=UPI0025894343|nr:hypothetical protein [uncultured Agrobacterium sp.]